MSDSSRFAGKVAIVTGSSNGMGRATAILFAQQGAKVTITGRNAERLEQTRQAILDSKVEPEHVLAVQADLTTEAGQDELVEKTIAKFGRLDILVNSAGGAFLDAQGRTGVVQNIEVFDKGMQINLRTIVRLTQKATPHLIASKGEIVMVSAIGAGTHASPQFIFEAMPKAALNQFTMSAAIDLIKHGVRVNSVSPGFVKTGFGAALGVPDAAFNDMMDFMASHKECIPYGAVAEPVEIAHVIAFLADRKLSGYIIGQSIVVDGGSSLLMGADAHDFQKLMGM